MKVQDDDTATPPVVAPAAHLAGTNPPYLGIASLDPKPGEQQPGAGAAQPAPAVATTRGVLRNYAFGELKGELYAKLPPQARVIVKAAEVLRDQQNNVFTAKDLTDASVKLGLTTRQLPERIIAYYLPRLRQEGFIL